MSHLIVCLSALWNISTRTALTLAEMKHLLDAMDVSFLLTPNNENNISVTHTTELCLPTKSKDSVNHSGEGSHQQHFSQQ